MHAVVVGILFLKYNFSKKQNYEQSLSKSTAVCLDITRFCFNMKAYKKEHFVIFGEKNMRGYFLVSLGCKHNRFEALKDTL